MENRPVLGFVADLRDVMLAHVRLILHGCVLHYYLGSDLQKCIDQDRLSKDNQGRLEEVQGIVRGASAGLEYLSLLGFYHGDISLRNMMWNP